MKCIITGKETNNKWRGYVICKEMVDLAKQMEGENGFLDTTLRERILILSQRWNDRAKEEADKKKGHEAGDLIIGSIMSKLRRIMA